MEIVNFSPEYYNDLLAFSKKMWPRNSEEYLKYRLFQIPENVEDNKHNLLVINEGKIVGCTLYMPTKARIYGKEENILWSHDMIVEEKYRGGAGLLLIIEMLKIKSTFGFGTTDINYKIQKELGTKFIGIAKHFIIFNFWSFKLLLIKLKLIGVPAREKYSFPDEISVKGKIFRRVLCIKELKIPDNGYWSNSSVDIDFLRDEHFLKNRFFENFNKYFFYKLDPAYKTQHDECYFVVRPTVEGGYPVLSLVDFRFNFKKQEQIMLVFKAVAKITKRNRIPLATVRTSLEYKKLNLFPLIFKRNSRMDIVTYFPVNTNLMVFITNADSDSDFLLE